MKTKVPFFARILLGLIFFIFGLNGFLNFIPPPPEMPEKAVAFFSGMMSTGYFLPFLKATEIACGLLLLSGTAVPAALIILTPVVIQIVLFHGFLTPGLENLILPLVLVVLILVASKPFWNLYRPLFGRKK